MPDNQQPGTEVATTREQPEIVKFRDQLEARAREMKMALPSHISPEKFQRTIITTTMSDPELLNADRQSLVLACMKAAQDGLLPDKREAAIVVFKESKKQADNTWKTRLIATYLPMVYGLRKKILQSGDVVALEVGVVYEAEVEAGKFFYEVGLEPPLRHRPMLSLTEEQTSDGQIVAAYSIATMKDGTRSYEVMRRFEIDRVRETSKTGATKDRNGQKRTPSGPWVDWFPEMAKKTVMRRHAKTLPQSGDIIIDVEGQELDAGVSTARALEQQPDAPQIEHRDDGHDPETGEIRDDDGQAERPTDGQGSFTDEREEPEKPKRTRRTREQIDADNAAAAASAEGNAPVSQATSDDGNGAATSPQDDQDSDGRGQTAMTSASHSEDEAAVEQEADNRHPAAEKAIELIGTFDKAETIIDLRARYNDAQLDLAAMPDDIAEGVEAAYQRRRQELGGK